MTISDYNIQEEIKKVRAEYRRKLRELRQRKKEALAKLYADYYFAVDGEERATIEAKILAILDDQRKVWIVATKLKTMLAALEQKEKVTADYRKKLRELRKMRKEALAKLYEAYYLEKDESQRALISTQIEKILDNERNDN